MSLQHEIDAELAESATSRPGRYSILAEASLHLRTGDGDPAILHGSATAVAEEVCADRVVIFRQEPDAQLQVVTSVGRTGRRLAEVRRLVRSVTRDGGLSRPYVAAAGAGPGRPISPRLAAVALIPVKADPATGTTLLLYADRLNSDEATAFTEADIEFLGASARLLAEALFRGATRGFGYAFDPEGSEIIATMQVNEKYEMTEADKKFECEKCYMGEGTPTVEEFWKISKISPCVSH